MHGPSFCCKSVGYPAAAALATCLAACAAAAAEPEVLLPGYVLEQFAAEPEIVTPVAAAFDARGRLVVVESHTHFRPPDYAGPARDRLRIVEDSDGDGRADRFRTLLDGLESATALRRGPDDWLYVGTRSEILRVRDGDGDDTAEIREPLVRLETAGTYPHNGLGGLAVDAAGRLWFGLGENLGAEYRLLAADGSECRGGGEGGSVFRCTADGRELERIATGFWNPFGLCADPVGRMLAVDNDPDSRPPCRLIDVVPTGDYGYQFRFGRGGTHPLQAWDGELPGTLPMAAGTGEAPCAAVVFDGGLWVTSWGGNRLERFTLEPRGASVTAGGAVAVQGDHRFRPVDAVVAPDGSLVFTDWVDRSYPVHGAGRIWRLRVAGPDDRRPPAAWPPLSAAEQRARALSGSAPGSPPPGPRDLGSPDPFIRQAAVAALVARGGRNLPPLESSGDPLVRQGILLAHRWLGLQGDPAGTGAAAEAVCGEAVADPDDRVRLPAIRWIAEAKFARLRPAVEEVTADGTASPQAVRAALAALAWLDGSADPSDAGRLAAIWGDSSRPEAVRAAALAAMPAGAAQPAALAELVRRGPPAVARAAARQLAMRWGTGAEELASLAADTRLPAERRADATAGLAKSPARHGDLLARLADDREPAVAREAGRASQTVPSSDSPRPAVTDIDAWLARLGDGGSADAGWRTFFATTGGRCAACHMLGGRGGMVGPDLTGIVARMGRRRVLESLLQPDKEIGPGYVAYALELTDGRVITGLSAGLVEKDTAERILTADGSATIVPLAKIESRTPLATSLMPSGLVQLLSDDDLRDLLAVLAEPE